MRNKAYLRHRPVIARACHLNRQSAALGDRREAVGDQLHWVNIHRGGLGGRWGRRYPRGDPGGFVRGPSAHSSVDFLIFLSFVDIFLQFSGLPGNVPP